MRQLLTTIAFTAVLVSGPLDAQSRDETLADIRQELSVLYVQVQRLKRELSTTGSSGQVSVGGSVIDRVGAIEGELQRLTAKTENLELRIDRVVTDGTNRIGDLEFRLVELEGGDLSQLGETTTLGGDVPLTNGSNDSGSQDNGPTVAIGETADFDAAKTALVDGKYAEAILLFTAFRTVYPGGPFSDEAGILRGEAMEADGQLTRAARAYLDVFSWAPNGPVAPDALYHLGRALGRLGKTEEACVTLGEVGFRFPGGAAADEARSEMQSLGCQ